MPQPSTSEKRIQNLIIDVLIINMLAFALNNILTNNGDESRFISEQNWIYILVFVGYYFIFESLFGKTPGKFSTNTKIVSENGMKPSLGSIFIRTIVRLIPIEFLSFTSSKNPIGWHDKWSKTIVIEDK